MDWMSSNEAENNVSLKFSPEDEFSKHCHKTLLSKELGCGWGGGQTVQSRELKQGGSGRQQQHWEISDGNGEIQNRSCCCSSRTEKREILRCLIQTNAIELLLGCTFNNSTARFQLSPILQRATELTPWKASPTALQAETQALTHFTYLDLRCLPPQAMKKVFYTDIYITHNYRLHTHTGLRSILSLHKPHLFVTVQGERFDFCDKEEMHIQIVIKKKCKPNNLLIKQSACHHISKSHLLNNMGYIRALHIAASKSQTYIIMACLLLQFVSYLW